MPLCGAATGPAFFIPLAGNGALSRIGTPSQILRDDGNIRVRHAGMAQGTGAPEKHNPSY